MPDPTRCSKCGQVHERCAGHNKKTGDPCGRWPTHGATVCRSHGAGAPQVKAAAARRIARERFDGELGQLLTELKAEAPLHPVDSLDDALGVAWAMMAALELMAGRLQLPGGLPEGGIVAAIEAGTITTEDVEALVDGGGVYGRNHLGDGAPHVVLDMLAKWTEAVAKISKSAIDAGLDAKRLELDKRRADLVGTILDGVAQAVIALVLAELKLQPIMRARLEETVLSQLPAMMGEQIRRVRELEKGAA